MAGEKSAVSSFASTLDVAVDGYKICVDMVDLCDIILESTTTNASPITEPRVVFQDMRVLTQRALKDATGTIEQLAKIHAAQEHDELHCRTIIEWWVMFETKLSTLESNVGRLEAASKRMLNNRTNTLKKNWIGAKDSYSDWKVKIESLQYFHRILGPKEDQPRLPLPTLSQETQRLLDARRRGPAVSPPDKKDTGVNFERPAPIPPAEKDQPRSPEIRQ